jgi:DNA repair protein RAD50
MLNFSHVKRKLSSAEYKDVDEQYRIANIKMITTNLAAQDLKKYGNALDKVIFHCYRIVFLC